ncbi:MAG: ATP-binding protein [Moorea sp. SIOASIH]|nr:ATP-binding protein [Moorena sp. SIOASIH]
MVSATAAAETQILINSTSPDLEISPDLNGLQPLLQRLDWLIQQAISVLEKDEKAEGEMGLSWWQKTGVSSEQTSIQIRADSLLAWLQKTFSLSAFDLDILAIALAPELDRQYERIYVYLQDDMSSKKPTVDLVLNLLTSKIPEKLSRRQHFTTLAPLIHHHLIYLSSESTQLAQYLTLDTQVIRLLLQPQPGLDSRLTTCCQLLEITQFPDTLYLQADLQKQLQALVIEDWQKQQPLLLYFQGTDSTGKRRTAQTLAKTLEVPLLVADLAKLVDDKTNFEYNLKLLWREAWFFRRLLYLENFDILYLQEHQILYQCFLRELEKNRVVTILAGVQNWIPTTTGAKGLITVPFTIPESSQRRECWQTHLQAAEISIEDKELDLLSARFHLTPDQIADAVATAYNTARWQSSPTNSSLNSSTQQPEKPQPSFVNLCSAARAQSGHDLATLARKIEPKYTWDDIVLQPNQFTQLQQICKEAEYQDLVHTKWGFADKLSLVKGLTVLFSGSPGTGKTMAAEVIAHHLQLDLYKIDLSQIVSKYIGETEKNLNRIFTAATNSNVILLFDEADALFGKRSEVQDARDRYANIEVGYLLQKMEEYEGIAILTTNFRSNMDEAFERRLRFIIEFPFPDAKNRHLIWQRIFPKTAPCSPDLDLEFLAQNLEITGANIRNIALTAAFLAADDGGVIEMVHLIQAMRREYQKMGQILRDNDLGQYVDLR